MASLRCKICISKYFWAKFGPKTGRKGAKIDIFLENAAKWNRDVVTFTVTTNVSNLIYLIFDGDIIIDLKIWSIKFFEPNLAKKTGKMGKNRLLLEMQLN